MGNHLRGWMVVGAMVLLCGAGIWFVARQRSRRIETPAALIARLPSRDAVIVWIDFAALRSAGLVDLLESSKTPEEPEYKQFVARTDFDYKKDLDLAAASFGPTGKFFLLRGRFNWTNLDNYARTEGGNCYNTLCSMSGSTPDRKISYFPLQSRIMSLAVSKDPLGAMELMQPAAEALQMELPADPVWIAFPGPAARQGPLPTGTQIFAAALEPAEQVILSLGARGRDFQISLNARCHDDRIAARVAGELEKDTATLRAWIARENRTPNPRDMSGVLAAGAFGHANGRVYGHWPVAQELIADAVSGEAR